MERLKMHQIKDILYRLRQGQSERGIAWDLNMSRDTVHRYHIYARELGYLTGDCALPDETVLQERLGPAVSPPRQISGLEPYRDLIVSWLEDGREKMVIHQTLTDHHGYTGSYSSVLRFVHQVRPVTPEVFVRIETSPGQQAQVDFGSAGRIRDPKTASLRPAYAFVMTLSWSRHMYVEFVFDQSIRTWISCHRNALHFFGGAPREIVLDNLKAGVLWHALEDPTLSLPYRRLAQHYGLLIHPCRPRTPRHKGKVESAVHYVKRNLVAGETFHDLDDANRKAHHWCLHRAGVRDHGTTHEPPLKRFLETEAAALLPLPQEPFDLLRVVSAKVQRDSHIVVEGAYYSVPCAYAGRRVEAYLYENTVQVYDGVSLLTTHPKARRKGERNTRLEHYPADKAIYLERTPGVCRELASKVGLSCAEVVTRLLDSRPADNLRAAQALVGLADKHGRERLEAACLRALFFQDPHYRRVKTILSAGLENEPLPGQVVMATPSPAYRHARGPEEFFSPMNGEATVVSEVASC